MVLSKEQFPLPDYLLSTCICSLLESVCMLRDVSVVNVSVTHIVDCVICRNNGIIILGSLSYNNEQHLASIKKLFMYFKVAIIKQRSLHT